MGSLRDFTRLERLEVPLPVLLGWKPPWGGGEVGLSSDGHCFDNKIQDLVSAQVRIHPTRSTEVPLFDLAPSHGRLSERQSAQPLVRNLRDVLPPTLRELCLRDDLFDTGDYLWTPWNSFVIGAKLDQSYQDTLIAEPVLFQLRNCLALYPESHSPASGHQYASAQPSPLKEICLKFQMNRLWPARYLNLFEDLCRGAGIMGKVELRLGCERHVFEKDDIHDLVEEIVLCDPKIPQIGRRTTLLRKPLQVLKDHD
ncbi:MAG: hypothetical protein Q9164_007199 [Protoblastenia rupestris]